MKLQQLKYLLAIVDNGLNITAAAERLYTSQPGVSKQLKLLEEELGLQLFVRRGKSLQKITPGGEQVISRARSIMEDVERIRSFAADFYSREEGTLTIAASNTQARYVLPDLLRRLQRRYPRVHFNLHQGTSDQVAHLVSGNEIDLAIASGPYEQFSRVLCIPGYQWERVLVVPRNHQLSKMDRPITVGDLADYPLVNYGFNFESDQCLQDMFADSGYKAKIAFTARDSDVVKNYVRMGVGVGIIASMAFEQKDHKDLSAVPVNGIFPSSTTWVGIRKNMMLRCYVTDFLGLFAPHLSREQIDGASKAATQQEVDELLRNSQAPLISHTFKKDTEEQTYHQPQIHREQFGPGQSVNPDATMSPAAALVEPP